MARTEPDGSMGTDTPLAVLSEEKLLFPSYFNSSPSLNPPATPARVVCSAQNITRQKTSLNERKHQKLLLGNTRSFQLQLQTSQAPLPRHLNLLNMAKAVNSNRTGTQLLQYAETQPSHPQWQSGQKLNLTRTNTCNHYLLMRTNRTTQHKPNSAFKLSKT